jgi:hypothetical protein
MSTKSQPPFVIRWRNDMLNDSRVKAHGRLAGMALTIYARSKDGHNCYPSAAQCAAKMGVSVSTIERGWKQLKDTGWLEIRQLPPGATRANGGRSAWKIMKWPTPAAGSSSLAGSKTSQKCHQCQSASLVPKMYMGEDTGMLECTVCGAANEPATA